ncbi:tRNA lysidine(34) synthetase TilS [Cytophagaceae bacterium ABcell3]|nr:tRNA lysidine(34) synthetase TilS [Cytophagaceae bacterium ABcell3]
MLDCFLRYITQKDLIRLHQSVIVAVSGGIDSVVLVDLLYNAGFKVAIAHCNFQLRGAESEEDELFVRGLAERLGVPFFLKTFDTQKIASQEKISIQMAARDIRYQWFEELRMAEGYDYVAVAHHKSDTVETVLLNLARGTGIAGLHGIAPKVKNIIRPLLFAGRTDIEKYAAQKTLDWREDSSNKSTKYARNLVRHKMIPLFKHLNPQFEDAMQQTVEKVSAIERIYKAKVDELVRKAVRTEGEMLYVDMSVLSKETEGATLLASILEPYNFSYTDAKNIFLVYKESGKVFLSDSHKLVTSRGGLQIAPLAAKQTSEVTVHAPGNDVEMEGKVFQTAILDHWKIEPDPEVCLADYDKLSFPLHIRHWKEGDKFKPLGMNGFKKLSDFLIDRKLSLLDKEKVLVLTSGENIVWVVGMRMDDRFKITGNTKKVVRIKVASL